MFRRRKEERDEQIKRLTANAAWYLDRHYVEQETMPQAEQTKTPDVRYQTKVRYSLRDNYDSQAIKKSLWSVSAGSFPTELRAAAKSLANSIDASFRDTMLHIIDWKHLRDSEVYKAAQIDRRLYSKIVSDRTYKPSKDTCISLCYALNLDLDETNDMLSRAGYALSHSSKRDVILEYFFASRNYDISYINEVLFSLEQKPLGRQTAI